MKKKLQKKNIIYPPKKPRTSYHYFFIIASIELRQVRFESTKKGQVITEISQLWKKFKIDPYPTSVLRRINKEAEKDRIRYMNEMIEWNISEKNNYRNTLSKKFKEAEEIRKNNFIKDVYILFDKKDIEIQKDLANFILV
jgi:hypothetical protein